MSKITLVIPDTFTLQKGKIGPYFAAKAGLNDPGMFGYMRSNGDEWSIHVGTMREEHFSCEGFTASELVDDLPKLADCALLVPTHDVDRVGALLRRAGHEVHEKTRPGELKTGSW